MRVGIIGAGAIFQSHVQGYRGVGVDIGGVADVDHDRASRAAAKHSIPFCTRDWQELLDRADADIIDICTPPKFHGEMAIAALQAGKHVIVEKPLAPSLAEVDQIINAEKEAPGKLTVVHQARYQPVSQRLKWLVDGKHVGKICFAQCLRYDAPPQRLVDQGVWGRWDLAGGGVLMTKAIHQLDLLCWLLGRPKRVHAMMGTFVCPIESEDHVVANLEFQQDTLADLCVSGHSHGSAYRLDLIGDSGAASDPWDLHLANRKFAKDLEFKLAHRYPLPGQSVGDNRAGRLRRLARKMKRKLARKLGLNRRKPVRESSHTPLFREFLAALEQGQEVPVSAGEARRGIELCTAIYSSALLRKPVDLPVESSDQFYKGINKSDYDHLASPRVHPARN